TVRLDDDFPPSVPPTEIGRIAFGQYFNFFSTNNDIGSIYTDIFLKHAMDRIIFKKMGKHVRIGQVIDSKNVNIVIFQRLTKYVTDNAYNTIYTYFNCHRNTSRIII